VTDLPFLDTNIVLYAYSQDQSKAAIAREVLWSGGVISVQTLNECINVFRSKQRRDWADIVEVLGDLRAYCAEPLPLTLRAHDQAYRIASRHGLRIFDAMIVATALEAGCRTLLSEDLQNGRVFNDRLTVRNPFATQ
jgi:predicted nucleic acid-binding protein